MKAKSKVAKLLAPIADKTARGYTGRPCTAIFHQPKLPKKLMNTVK